MSQIYNKIIAGAYDNAQLQAEINESALIVPSCLSITGNDTTIDVDFAAALSTEEETELDALIINHVPTPVVVDIATLPFSTLGNKLGVHQSTKPEKEGKEFYLVWTGSGDNCDTHELGGGDLLTFDFSNSGSPIPTELYKDVKFDPMYGDVYIHEAYMKNSGAPSCGPTLTAQIIGAASPLQTAANLDLVIEDDWVTWAPTGPGTGTHGFAGTPTLVPRSFMHDGEWDYDPVNGLSPNLTKTGDYKISNIDRIAHKYINRVPLCGEQGFTRMTSDETSYLPPGYFIRVWANNPNQEALRCAFFFEVYRERTAVP